MLCFRMISPSGSIYRLKIIGPKMDPWGIPYKAGADNEKNWQIDTEKVLCLKGERNQNSAVSLMPTW